MDVGITVERRLPAMPKARRVGNYLKAADIGGRGGTAIVKIEAAGEHNITDYRPDGALEIPVTPATPTEWTTGGRDSKTWSLNRTSEETLLDYIDEDSENWVGKLARVNAVRQNVRGTMRDILYSEALAPREQPTGRAPPPTTPKTKPTATPETKKTDSKVKPPIVSDETSRYLKYNEQLIGQVINPGDWNSMPENIRKELASLNWIVYEAGYPTLSPNAKQVLQ